MFQIYLFLFIDENVVSWIFGNSSRTLDEVEANLNVVLQTRIDLIARECDLTDKQRETLMLAGQGDIHRFFNDYQTLRRKIPIGTISQQEYQEVWQDIQPVRTRYSAGLYNQSSLLEKTIDYVLEDHQRSRYDAFVRERRQRQYEAIVRGTLAMIENEMPLTSDQREKIVALLMEDIPKANYHNINYYHQYLVLYQLSMVPQQKLQAVLLENEWESLGKLIQRFQGYKPSLIQNGVLIDD
ncbi:MAG: hypothetical protein HUJ26_15775 [Planctomycetaceae bacterium]|nr:hypothetical protein [Planctomycetaceae bacterium]